MRLSTWTLLVWFLGPARSIADAHRGTAGHDPMRWKSVSVYVCDSKEVEAACIIYISHSQVGFRGGRYLEANQKDKHSKINMPARHCSHGRTKNQYREPFMCVLARGCICIQMKHHFECYSLVETGGTLNTYKYFLVMSTRSADQLYAHIDTAPCAPGMAGTVDDKPWPKERAR